MKTKLTRRRLLAKLSAATAALLALPAAQKTKAAVRKLFTSSAAPKGYDPTAHKYLMAVDVDRCIGCGLCVEACSKENKVPQTGHHFRTWIERYVITKPDLGSGEISGEVIVDSPNGGMNGFPRCQT